MRNNRRAIGERKRKQQQIVEWNPFLESPSAVSFAPTQTIQKDAQKNVFPEHLREPGARLINYHYLRNCLPARELPAVPRVTAHSRRTGFTLIELLVVIAFLFVDGSGHFVTDSIDLIIYRRLATIREGTTAELP